MVTYILQETCTTHPCVTIYRIEKRCLTLKFVRPVQAFGVWGLGCLETARSREPAENKRLRGLGG